MNERIVCICSYNRPAQYLGSAEKSKQNIARTRFRGEKACACVHFGSGSGSESGWRVRYGYEREGGKFVRCDTEM